MKECGIFIAGAILLSWGDAFHLPSQGLDESWAEGLVHATDNGRVFGADTIFFYGPYHQIATGQISENLGPLLLGRWLSGIAFGSLMVMITRMSSLLSGFIFLCLLSLTVSQNYNALIPLLAAGILIASSLLPVDNRTNLLFIGLSQVGLVLGLFIKLSFVGAVLVALICSPTILILRHGKHGSPALRGPITFMVLGVLTLLPLLWALASQPLQALVGYVAGANMDIIKGYSSAMAYQDFSIAWQIPIYWAGAVIILLAFQRLLAHRINGTSKLEQTISILALSTSFWVIFKAGMVRHEPLHAATAGGYLFSVALVIASITANHSNQIFHRLINPLAPLPLLAIPIMSSLAMVNYYISPLATPIHSLKPLETPVDRLFKSRLANTWILFGATFGKERHRSHLKMLRKTRLEKLKQQAEHWPIGSSASVDILPWDISAIRAGGYRYHPSPVLQSISAYTERLQAVNALHFQGEQRPDFLILEAKSIDNRPPLDLLDDEAFQSIVRNYRFAGHGSKASLLYKSQPGSDANHPIRFRRIFRDQCSTFTKRAEADHACRWITLPPLEPGSYLTVRIKATRIRKVFSLLYKPSHLEIIIKLSNGRTRTYTLVDQATNLIPLNPFVLDTEDLRRFIDAASRSDPSASDHRGPTPLKLMIHEWSPIPTINTAVIDVHSPVHASTSR